MRATLVPRLGGIATLALALSASGALLSAAGATPGVPTPFSVGDRVWWDLNGDGEQDSQGEPGIAGVTVTLTDADGGTIHDLSGADVGPQTTDASGHYLFQDLPTPTADGQYVVHIDDGQPALSGYTPTTAHAIKNDNIGDSSTGSQGTSAATTFDAADTSIDFGFTKPTEIPPYVWVGDQVWSDVNGNGIQDGDNEAGLLGVTLTITGPQGGPVTDVLGRTVVPQVTDSEGTYAFTLLPVLSEGQSYTVHVDATQSVLADSYVHTLADQGSDRSQDSDTGSATSGPLVESDSSDPTLDFGFIPVVNVTGTISSSGQTAAAQRAHATAGIPGVVVTLTGPNGASATDAYGAPVPPATTDASGTYRFGSLALLASGQTLTVHVDPNQSALSGYVAPANTSATTTGNLTSAGAHAFVNFAFSPKAAVIAAPTPSATPIPSPRPVTHPRATTKAAKKKRAVTPVKQLAYTGAPTGELLAFALGLLVVGAGLLWAGRRAAPARSRR